MTRLIQATQGGAARPLGAGLVFTIAYTLLVLVAAGIDGRTIGGEGMWLKPLKFGVATLLYLGTLLWAVNLLSEQGRSGRAAMGLANLAVFCAVFEIVYIGIQAARGEASHFNLSTPFYTAMYSMMAIGAVALVLCGAGLGWVLLKDEGATVSEAMRWSVGICFWVSTVLTIVTAMTMGGRLNHHAGLEAAVAARVPILGWSLTVGDLRVPHFLATHLMQAGPLFAWFATRHANRTIAIGATAVFCIVWTGVTLLVFQTVLAGRPFLAFRSGS